MRRYDEAIEVRRGLVCGQEAPMQFLWRNRLWVVRDIIAHWVQTGAWWEQPHVSALFGSVAPTEGAEAATAGVPSLAAAEDSPLAGGPPLGADLLEEREVWRVEAMCARTSTGVFDVSFDWALGQWRLLRCID
jgi:hypothetical protein